MSVTRTSNRRAANEHFEPDEASDPQAQRQLRGKLEQIDYTAFVSNREVIGQSLGRADAQKFQRLGVAAALAILSKGIVVGVLTGGSLVVYSLIERDVRPWKRLHAVVGVPLFLLVAAPWFIAVSMRNPDFPEFFFIHEHFARFLRCERAL